MIRAAGYPPAPYVWRLRFVPAADTADPNRRTFSEHDLRQAEQEGRHHRPAISQVQLPSP